MDAYLSPSRFIDSDHPVLVEFAEEPHGTHWGSSDPPVSIDGALRTDSSHR